MVQFGGICERAKEGKKEERKEGGGGELAVRQATKSSSYKTW